MIGADIRFVRKCWCVDRQEQHVVTTLHQFGGHGVIAQAASAIHPSSAAREIKNSHLKSSNSDGLLEGTTRVQMIEEIAFVRLVPTDLIGRERADVEAIDTR